MEAISGRKTIQEIAADHAIHPIQVSQWKKPRDKGEGQVKRAELFQQIGRLQMELEWLKKSLSCSDAHDCASWSITTILSSVSAVNVRCWACLDTRFTTTNTGAAINAANDGQDRCL
jgi:hypothetical protein